LGSLLTAAAVAVGVALAGVPNVELMTLVVFVSGFLLGTRTGAVIGAASIAVHSLFNPLGVALPPLLAAQIIGFAVIGGTGGWLGPALVRMRLRTGAFAAAATAGLLLTAFYDVLTNVGAFYTITGEHRPGGLVQFVAAGMVFTIMHVVWNTALFGVTLRPILIVFERYRDELRGGR
jgi:hypothetical protein